MYYTNSQVIQFRKRFSKYCVYVTHFGCTLRLLRSHQTLYHTSDQLSSNHKTLQTLPSPTKSTSPPFSLSSKAACAWPRDAPRCRRAVLSSQKGALPPTAINWPKASTNYTSLKQPCNDILHQCADFPGRVTKNVCGLHQMTRERQNQGNDSICRKFGKYISWRNEKLNLKIKENRCVVIILYTYTREGDRFR